METTDGLGELLRRLRGDAAGVGAVASWLTEPVAEGFFRVVVIAGATTQLQLVAVASLGRR